MSSPIKVNLSNVTFLDRAQDFIEEYDFPKDLLLDVVRQPQSREMDPSSPEKGYPVVRCRRGDITVVLGIQNPEAPCVIHVWLHTPDEDHTGGTKKTGGASGSKTPHSVNQLKGWLQAEGCRLVNAGAGGHTRVLYGDTFLGTISGTPSRETSVKNEYSRMRKKLAAMKVKQEILSQIKEK